MSGRSPRCDSRENGWQDDGGAGSDMVFITVLLELLCFHGDAVVASTSVDEQRSDV